MAGSMREVRHAVRRLGRAPVFSGVAVLTVAVGIGAFASVLSVVESVLLEPVPYDDPEELVWIWRDYSAWFPLDRGWLGGPDVVYLREREDVFEGVAAVRTGRMNLTGRSATEPAEIPVMLASASLFRVLGVEPVLGRGFLSGEDEPDAPAVAVLSHELWRGRYGGDRTLLGRKIYLDGEPTRVVGVAPEDFRFAKHGSQSGAVGAEIYLPLRTDLAAQNPGSGFVAGLARVRDGVSRARMEKSLARVADRLDEEAFGGKGLRLWSVSLKEDLVAPVRPALLALFASASFLLLILAANLATLFLGRAAVRDRELAVKAALGARRERIVGSLLGESLLVALAGGALGLLAACWGAETIQGMAPPDLPRRAAIGLDASVAVGASLVALAMGMAAGSGPALRVLRRDLALRVGEGSARSGEGAPGTGVRGGLVVVQVALSIVLLVGGGLLGRAFADLVRADPGFDPGSSVTFRVPLDPSRYGDSASVVAFQRAFRRRLEGLPGVEAVGAANALPLTAGVDQGAATFPGAPGNTGDEDRDRAFVDFLRTSPGYAEAVGLRVQAGRVFREDDGQTSDSTGVAVIDDVLARRFFPDGGAVGATVRVWGLDLRILGVVDQARLYQVHEDGRGQVFLPLAMSPDGSVSWVIRAGDGSRPMGWIPSVRTTLREMDSELPLTDVRTLEELVRSSIGQQRLSLILVLGFALGAFLLAVLGLYGVVANSVVRRTREMGVRMALGADGRRVVAMVLGQGLRLTAVGAVLGLGGALFTARFLEGVVVGLEAADPLVYAGMAVGVILVATAASYLPARRATRIDPATVLRQE